MEINAGCTFCSITNNRPVPKETILHLFYICPTINKIIETFYENYIIRIVNNKSNYFLSEITTNERLNNVLNIVWDVFRYVVWQFKLKQKAPVYSIFDEEMQYHFAIINSSSPHFRDALIDCPFLQTNRPADGQPPNPEHDELRP